MNTDEIKAVKSESDIPLFIRVALLFITIALCTPSLIKEPSFDNLINFVLYSFLNLIFLPGVFVIIGLLLKLRDNTFKVSNAYYLGVLMAIVLLVQSLKGA